MILVTLGTQKQEFTRLLDAIENSNINDEIIVQAGHTKYDSQKMKILDFVSYEEMEKLVERADYIITHGGTGSIVEPLKKGKKIIACARMQKYGEHVDNHQEELVSIFSDQGYILELKDGESLDDVMEKAKTFTPNKYESNTEKFMNELKEEINVKPQKSSNSFWIGLILLVTFYIISLLAPIGGDDWGGKLNGSNNIIENFKLAFERYFTLGGRIVANTLVMFFINTEWLWNIVNAAMVCGAYFIICKISGVSSRKIMPFLVALSVIFLESTIFTQCYLWIAGNCTYTMPTFLCLVYFALMNKIWKKDYSQSKLKITLCCIINLLASMMAESVGAALVFANALLLVYTWVKNKKINKNILIYFIISLAGFLVMILSPGSSARLSSESSEFGELSLIGKCLYNLKNFVKFTYMENNVLMALLTACIFIIVNKNVRNKVIKILTSIYLLVPVINIIANLLTSIASTSSKATALLSYIDFIRNSESILIQIYWITFTLLLIYIAFRFVKDKYKALFYLFVGLSSNLALLLSPISGHRTALFTVYMLYAFSFILLGEVDTKNTPSKIKSIFGILVKLAFVGTIALLLVIYSNVRLMQIDREEIINKGIRENSKEITLLLFPEEVLHNLNAWHEGHLANLKKYYGIDEDVKIKRVRTKWIYSIIYLREDLNMYK